MTTQPKCQDKGLMPFEDGQMAIIDGCDWQEIEMKIIGTNHEMLILRCNRCHALSEGVRII